MIAAPAPGGIRPHSISITKPKVADVTAATTTESNVAEPVAVYNQSFSDDDFFRSWYNFLKTLSDEKMVGFKNLNIPVRTTENVFEVLVNNVMQENEAKKLLQEAVQFIRNELRNSSITVNTKIAEENEMQRSLSPEQRYLEMVAKNPQLEQFRKMLSLEID